MGLLDLKTDLKSLKFGNPPASDRPGGGNSGQPYITDPIESSINPQSEDFLLRGGFHAPLDAANDVIRLTKFFGDLKSPRGVLFVAKQNILSRIGVATQANGKNWEKSPLNEGAYTPLSTIAQAGVGFAGAHLNKQGLNPLKGVNTYIDSKTLVIGEDDGTGNRLVDFYNKNILQSNLSPTLYSYSGGPGSKLGIGKTNIEFATDNKGAPLKTGIKSTIYPTNNVKQDLPFYNPLVNFPSTKITGVSTKYYDEVPLPTVKIGEQLPIFGELGNSFILNANSLGRDFSTSVYDGGSLLSNTPRINDNGTSTWDQFRIAKQVNPNDSKGVADPILQDFRAPLLENKKSSTIMSLSPSYKPNEGKTKAIDGVAGSRINMTSPGQKGNIINYTKGKIINEKVSVVDYINYQPLYKSSDVRGEGDGIAKNDLVKFRIGAVLRDGEKVFMHFRAFIDQFSDSYSAKWSGIQYMGRGEEFYKYGGFGRKISLSYTVAAQSKPELMAQYKKLNFLASTLSPDYGKSGYMGGVLTTLTLGGWCYELPGFIDSLTLDIPQESPWEIAIPSTNDGGDPENPTFSDKTVKEMPHICKVTMNFTPIHRFRPELQKNDYKGPKSEVSEYGDQRYIGLTNGYNNNYRAVSLAKAETPNTKQSKGGSGYKS